MLCILCIEYMITIISYVCMILYVCIALMQQYGYVKLYQYDAKKCENM